MIVWICIEWWTEQHTLSRAIRLQHRGDHTIVLRCCESSVMYILRSFVDKIQKRIFYSRAVRIWSLFFLFAGMDVDSPPLMRKLLIGQIVANHPTGALTYDTSRQLWTLRRHPSRPLVWGLVWLQGTVQRAGIQSGFCLDDSTGLIRVEQADDSSSSSPCQPKTGEYACVIGRLVGPSDSGNGDWLVQAKHITVVRATADNSSDPVPSRGGLNKVAVAELSWPMEVKDMTEAF